jgi:hypothetical protein
LRSQTNHSGGEQFPIDLLQYEKQKGLRMLALIEIRIDFSDDSGNSFDSMDGDHEFDSNEINESELQ